MSIAETAINRSVITTCHTADSRPNRSHGSLIGSACCLGLALLCLFWLPLEISGAQASAIGETRIKASQFWLDPQCGQCHQPQRTDSHPVDVIPTFPTPEAFVLTDGRMTCQTCHDVITARDHTQARLTKTVKLKGSGHGNTLCQSCHTQTDSPLTRTMHGSLGGLAHERTETGQSRQVRWTGAGPNANRSSQCLSCHDGVLASDSRIRMGNRRFSQAGMSDHPVNVSYSQATRDMTRNDADGRLVERTRLDPRLRLFNGELSCETCHSLYSEKNRLLVISNQRSQLCTSCHKI